MMISTGYFRAALGCILSSGLMGCMGGALYTPPGRELTNLPPAPLGIAIAGDRYYFANGRREKFTAVENGLIDVRRSSSYQYLRFHDFTLPAKSVSSRNGVTSFEVVKLHPETSLWPLAVGKRTRFSVVKTNAGTADGEAANPRSYWECSVEGMQTVAVISGEFETYRVECLRKNSRDKIKQYVTYYYAPDIQQVVLRTDGYSHKPAKQTELVAFRPSLSMLSSASERRFQQHFQNTLETVASGTTTSWWSRRSDTRIHTTPTHTRKLGTRLYCRNFLMRVSVKGSVRSGAGLACRNAEGKWRIPRKIDIHRGELTF
ncbi:MAG: hypothetical protein H6965_11810 [Chromatiaceae bacterium]|nr:hypothetical protein [Chromatiaceae bacterium]